jgi:hypothetical protein
MVLKRKIIVLWEDTLIFRLDNSGTQYSVKFPIEEPGREPEQEKIPREPRAEGSLGTGA